MRMLKLFLFLAALTVMGAVLVRAATPDDARAQADAAIENPRPVMEALARDLEQVEEKMVALAEAIPASSYDWLPAEGVRSVSEVLVHVAADNWFFPTAVGVPAPEATGILADDYQSIQDYEARAMTPDEAVDALRESFRHLEEAMAAVDDAGLHEPMEFFGQEYTPLQLWVLATTHVHEHLGQLIAYARTNGVAPPWSG